MHQVFLSRFVRTDAATGLGGTEAERLIALLSDE